MAEEDRNKLFNEIKNFSQRKLKKVETKVTTGSGEQLTEKRSPKGLQQIKSEGINSVGYVVDTKPDLQVGMIIPGLFISSQDVAQDKSLLDTYEITHILNLAPGVPNAFEDDYNYKKIEILDVPETDITQYFDDCIDFIQEGIQRGNCLVHCNAGVSRSTAICCAYLMKQNKMKYKETLAAVREARAFAKPNDGFAKQLEQYEDKLFGQMAAPDSSEDKFMARKRAEIEAEKAAISGTSSVKNKLAQFGAQLESVYAQRLETMKPIKLPLKKKTPATQPQKQQQPIVKNNKKTNATDTPLPPPPPPPPLPELGNQIVPPPPPPPNSLLNKGQTTTNKKAINNKVLTNENKTNIVKPKADLAINKKELADSPKRTAKSDMVDETPIKVAAQKKLWESAHNKQPEINNVQNKKPVKVKAAQPQAIQPIAKPSPPVTQSQPQQPDIAVKAPNKGPVRSNKLGTWEKCPSSTPVSSTVTNSKADIASPEPKKKITIKKKDVNNNIINNNESGQPRRSTRDLSSTIESSATDSNSSTPFSSPGTQRRQMYYGRRTSTQPIASEQQQPQQQQPVASRKPTWGLRDQVDNLIETTPSSTPTRCRSPALVPTPRDSHSPSPQPAGIAGSGKKVFGRVPPRRTSLSGNGAVGQNNLTNDLPVVSTTTTTKTSSNNNGNVSQPIVQNKFKNKEPEIIKTSPIANRMKDSNKVDKINEPIIDERTNNTMAKSTKQTQPTSSTSLSASEDQQVRTGFKKTPLRETKERSVNRSIEARRKSKGLNRSSTAEILKLIKTKSRGDFGKSMETVDEDVEIEYLLGQLEEDGLENIDWEDIGLDEKEVKEIVEKNKDENGSGDNDDNNDDESSSEESEESSSEEDSDSDSDSDDDMEHTVFKPITPSKPVNDLAQPKITSTATLTLKPVQNSQPNKLEVESDDETDDSSEEETESD